MDDDLSYVICELADIPSRQARGFVLARPDESGAEQPWPIFVVRWGRQVFAYENRCPHGGTRLDWERDQFMDGSGEHLICGKHGAVFELDTGLCYEGPCDGEQLRALPVRVEDGAVCLFGIRLAEG